MGFWSDLLGVLGNTFRIGRKATIDASGLTAARTFTLPDAGGTIVVGAGIPVGGSDGQVLTKQSGTDFDVAWEDASGGGGGTSYSFGGSLAESGGDVSLVNDNATPGNSLYYGTDSGGTKGFHALPSPPGPTAVNDLADATAAGAVDSASYAQVWNWSSLASDTTAWEIQIGSTSQIAVKDVGGVKTIVIAQSGGAAGFFGVTPVTRQSSSSDPNASGISSLTVSDPPTQAEVAAIRDAAASVATILATIRNSLNATGLLQGAA